MGIDGVELLERQIEARLIAQKEDLELQYEAEIAQLRENLENTQAPAQELNESQEGSSAICCGTSSRSGGAGRSSRTT